MAKAKYHYVAGVACPGPRFVSVSGILTADPATTTRETLFKWVQERVAKSVHPDAAVVSFTLEPNELS